MRIQIRKSVFETNSSSTHAISISGNSLRIPESLHFICGEFGWECKVYKNLEDKASYLWTYIFNRFAEYDWSEKKEDGSVDWDKKPYKIYKYSEQYQDWKAYLEKICKDVGVMNVTFQETVTDYDTYFDNSGYIDHSYELNEFIDTLRNNEHLLKHFLFCDDSGIETGNDNDDYEVSFIASNEIYDFYKGN